MTERNQSAGPLYPNQPLQEVAAEIRFAGRLRVEQIRADFQDSVRDKYPSLFVPKISPNIAPAMQHYRLESPEAECGIQLSVNSLVFYARDYPGFDAFYREATRLFEQALQMIGEVDATRIGWRYINAIPFPNEKGLLPFAKVFRREPWLTSAMDGEWETFSTNAVAKISNAKVKIQLVAGTEQPVMDSELLIFDIDAYQDYRPPIESMSTSRCFEEIRRLHDIARDVFERSINEDYRRFLKGGEK